MPWRVLSGYRPYQVHPSYFSPPSPSPNPGGNSSSSHAGTASSPPPPSSPTRPERQQLQVATALSFSSPAVVPLAVPPSASSIGEEASQARHSAYRSNHTVPGLSLFIPAAARFLSNATPSLHHSLKQSQNRNRNHPSNARHHSSTAPTQATATEYNRNWTRHSDDIPSLFHPQHQTPHPYHQHQHQRRQQTRMDPTIARLFTSNEQWKEAVGQAEPSFFAETAKGQAPKVCVDALTSTPSRLSPPRIFVPYSFYSFRPHFLT